MIRFILVMSRDGSKIIEEEVFKAGRYTVPCSYKGWNKIDLIAAMESHGFEYRYSRVGQYSQEYYDVTEEQAVIVKMFMQ